MIDGLARLQVKRLTGDEPFTENGVATDFLVRDFWQWASSNLVVNLVRGLLAEYLVAKALGLAEGVRDPWQPYDLRTTGGLTVEVKSAAYLQSWWQRTHSEVWFSARETRAWDANTNKFDADQRWQADVYVFALLKHRDKPTLDPRDLDQWEFYVLPTRTLIGHARDRRQFSLKFIQRIQPTPIHFHDLNASIKEVEFDPQWRMANHTL